jgi:hypothetical protein
MPNNLIDELRETTGAVCAYSEIMLEIAEGNLDYNYDTRIVRNRQGQFNAQATDTFQWAKTVYTRNPPLFNLIESVYYLFNRRKANKLERYLDAREKQR